VVGIVYRLGSDETTMPPMIGISRRLTFVKQVEMAVLDPYRVRVRQAH
jgi:hypothetical protein